MRKFFESKFAFGAIFVLFTAGFIWNSSQGALPPAGDLSIDHLLTLAHGPNMPPDPWDGNVAAKHGPNMPPDPWDGNVAAKHGPNMPPDPWDGNLAMKHGPHMLSDPWDGNISAA
jgi:hypothetical protein